MNAAQSRLGPRGRFRVILLQLPEGCLLALRFRGFSHRLIELREEEVDGWIAWGALFCRLQSSQRLLLAAELPEGFGKPNPRGNRIRIRLEGLLKCGNGLIGLVVLTVNF